MKTRNDHAFKWLFLGYFVTAMVATVPSCAEKTKFNAQGTKDQLTNPSQSCNVNQICGFEMNLDGPEGQEEAVFSWEVARATLDGTQQDPVNFVITVNSDILQNETVYTGSCIALQCTVSYLPAQQTYPVTVNTDSGTNVTTISFRDIQISEFDQDEQIFIQMNKTNPPVTSPQVQATFEE